MNYQQKSFSVPQSGRDPATCEHGWIAKGRCVFCGRSEYAITEERWDAIISKLPSPPEA